MYLKLGQEEIKIIEAKTFYQRLKGLMGEKNIYYGMLFRNCNSIHTFFMKENIDVIGLNEEDKVIYIYRNLPKNQIIKVSHEIKNTSILELPKNTSKKIQMGNTLLFKDEDII